MGEVSSSTDHDEDIAMRPTVAYFSAVSTSGAQRGVLSKENSKVDQQDRKKSKECKPPAMRAWLHQRDASATRQLDEELTSLAQSTTLIQSQLKETNLEIMNLFHHLLASLIKRKENGLQPRKVDSRVRKHKASLSFSTQGKQGKPAI
ncbi:hypothetical protein Fot_19677 [Forsythia ovata]|uniref:Uncharacterized protein n=1 Tax=Forsythia ovata TaxID=205694 RepID=A0ABD1VLQ1_9LAMI